MSIPGFQDFLLPLLEFCRDGREHSLQDAAEYCFAKLNVPVEERNIKSEKGTRIAKNRVGWAKTYLAQAKMLESVRRGVFVITGRGLAYLKKNPAGLKVEDLKQYKEFLAFFEPAEKSLSGKSKTKEPEECFAVKTPEERIEEAMVELKSALAAALMEQIKKSGAKFFEKTVVRLIAKMGYGEGQQTPYSHDGGIDGIINQDKLGLDAIYLQAKMWEGNVGKPQLQSFAGALEENKASKGIFITSGDFAKGAKEYIEKISKKIVLINGEKLVELMMRYNVGVSVDEEKTYQIKTIDSDFFSPEE